MIDRMDRLRTCLRERDLDAILISKSQNRRYISGFTGSAGYVVVTDTQAVLATDFRYLEQAGNQSPNFRIHRITGDPWLGMILRDLGSTRVGFESQDLTVAQLQQFVREFSKLPAKERPKLVETAGLMERLRAIKEPSELQALQSAIDIADRALATVEAQLHPGMTEQQVAWEIERTMRELGAESVSFDLIVGAGANSALPHHHPSDTLLLEGKPIVIDIGAQYQGYCSDLTRTLCIGNPDDTFRRVYDTVLAAQLTAINTLKAGLSGADGDALARTVIEASGYGDYFGHSLGHGVGLEVHEYPRLGPRSPDELQNDMVFTVEPGIYIPGWGGVRIEDVVMLEDGHTRVLSHAAKWQN